MTIVAHLDLELYQIDVKIVLLHSELKEEIYITTRKKIYGDIYNKSL